MIEMFSSTVEKKSAKVYNVCHMYMYYMDFSIQYMIKYKFVGPISDSNFVT